MSCPCPNVFSIHQGNKKVMTLKATHAGCGADPLDLTSAEEIDIALPLQDGTFAHLLLSEDDVTILSPEVLGKYQTEIDEELSVLLNVGELQTFNVSFTIGGEIFTVTYVNALSVFQAS